MPRTSKRPPDASLRIGRMVCIGGELFEIAVCVALLFLLPWPTNLIVVLVTATMLTSYNIVLWRTLKQQAVKRQSEPAATKPTATSRRSRDPRGR